MKTVTCATCHIQFCLTDELYQRRHADGKGFYCPAGHALAFRLSRVQDLEKQMRKIAKDRDDYHDQYLWLEGRVAELQAQVDYWRGQATGYKGQWAKLRNQVQSVGVRSPNPN